MSKKRKEKKVKIGDLTILWNNSDIHSGQYFIWFRNHLYEYPAVLFFHFVLWIEYSSAFFLIAFPRPRRRKNCVSAECNVGLHQHQFTELCQSWRGEQNTSLRSPLFRWQWTMKKRIPIGPWTVRSQSSFSKLRCQSIARRKENVTIMYDRWNWISFSFMFDTFQFNFGESDLKNESNLGFHEKTSRRKELLTYFCQQSLKRVIGINISLN